MSQGKRLNGNRRRLARSGGWDDKKRDLVGDQPVAAAESTTVTVGAKVILTRLCCRYERPLEEPPFVRTMVAGPAERPGELSIKSPMGKAIKGKGAGVVVDFRAWGKDDHVKILAVVPPSLSVQGGQVKMPQVAPTLGA